MGKHSKPAAFRVNGKVNLAKSTDKKGVYAEPVISSTYSSTKEALNQSEQQEEDRLSFVYRFFKFFRSSDDFVGFLALMFLIFVCIAFISMDHLTIWLTDLYGVEKGKIRAVLIIIAADIIVGALQIVAGGLYDEFEDKYAHKE